MRFGHWDKPLSKQYRKSGRFQSSDSKVLIRKNGSERFELAGIDKTNLRSACLARDGYKCVDAGKHGITCDSWLQMSHEPAMSKSEGSDILEQVRTRCWKHHAFLDNHGQPAYF